MCMATMLMANKARTEDVEGTSASEIDSSSNFDTAMQCRHEGRRHRPAIVHVHQQRGGGLDALHGEERRHGLRTRFCPLRRSASVGVGERPAIAKNIGAASQGTGVTSAVVPMPTSRRTRNWTNAALCDAITDDGMKVKATSRKFGILANSLRDHLLGKTTSRQRGNPPALKLDEEKKLVDYIFKM